MLRQLILIADIDSPLYSTIIERTFCLTSFLAKIKPVIYTQQNHIGTIPDALAVLFGMNIRHNHVLIHATALCKKIDSR